MGNSLEALANIMANAVAPLKVLGAEATGLLRDTVALIPNVLAALLVILVTWLLARLLTRLAAPAFRRSHMRDSLSRALVTLFRISVWLFGLLVAATILFPNLTPTKLLAGFGLGTIAIGLAFKDIFENFLSGILILVRQPMRIGDDVECEGVEGRVEEITLRDTYLRKRSGELVLVPNSFLFKNPVQVLTDRPKRRIALAVGLPYDTDLPSAEGILRQALQGLSTVDHSQRCDVFVTAFGDSSIDFLVRWWAGSTPIEEHTSRHEVALAIKSAFDAAGIDIPFPQRTLSFAEPLALSEPAAFKPAGRDHDGQRPVSA